MISNPSILRRTYDGVAMFALLNMVALGGLSAYIAAKGVVDGEKLRRIVGLMRGEETEPIEVAEVSHSIVEPVEPAARAMGGDALAESQRELEILRREAERIRAELDQRLALNNSILLKVMTERERFRQERQRADALEEQSEARRRQEGFKRQVTLYESLSPKVALQHLLVIEDPGEAAEILMALDSRKAKGIIEAAKREEDLEKMKTILQRTGETAPERAGELGSIEP